MRTKGEIEYRNCKINFTITQVDAKFSAFAGILYFKDGVGYKEVIRDHLSPSIEVAELAIIQKAKDWIDNNI